MTGNAPPIGIRTQIAYDPYNPADAIIPGAHLLADADQGRVTAREPLGRRTDSPSQPDEHALAKARTAGALRQLRVDAALIVSAPLLGLVWAYLDQVACPAGAVPPPSAPRSPSGSGPSVAPTPPDQ